MNSALKYLSKIDMTARLPPRDDLNKSGSSVTVTPSKPLTLRGSVTTLPEPLTRFSIGRDPANHWPIPDRKMLRDVRIPTVIVTIDGDEIHPAELGRILADLMPNAELLAFEGPEQLFGRIPQLVARISALIAGSG